MRKIAIVVAAGLALAACASDGPRVGSAVSAAAPAVGSDFAVRAVAACETALQRVQDQGAFPYPDFNPTDPDVSKFPEIADYLSTSVETVSAWLSDMQALGDPPSGLDAWNDLIAAIQRHVELDVEQQAAAATGDTETFTADFKLGLGTRDALFRAAEAAGVPECADVDR